MQGVWRLQASHTPLASAETAISLNEITTFLDARGMRLRSAYKYELKYEPTYELKYEPAHLRPRAAQREYCVAALATSIL